jgi:hypothetical protein
VAKDKQILKKSVSIALDPVTRLKFDIAARRSNTNFSNYVVIATQRRVEQDEAKLAPLTLPSGEALSSHALACHICIGSESQQFMRMAFIARSLLRFAEKRRFVRIIKTKEFWLRDPRKYPPLLDDLSEPKRAVFNYALLEERWASLLRAEKEHDAEIELAFKPLIDSVSLWQGTKPATA